MSDNEWYTKQLASIGITPTDERNLFIQVQQLLSVFEQQAHDERTATRVLDLFNDLARGHAITPEDEPERWQPVQLGAIQKGATVRVKADAFSGPNGLLHNGRRGVIVDGRRGDVIVDLRDDGPEVKGFHYQAKQLEQLVL